MAPVRTGGGMRMKVLQAIGGRQGGGDDARGTEGYTGFGEEPPLVGRPTSGDGDRRGDGGAARGRRRGGARSGERAREFAERHHSPEAWAERLTAVYEEARAARMEAAMAEPPQVSVIIPTHQRREALRRGAARRWPRQTVDAGSLRGGRRHRRLDRRHRWR